MIVAGIDAGSRAIKVALLDAATRTLLATGMADQGPEPARRAGDLLDRLLAEQRLARADIAGLVATGYARNHLELPATTVTEITCHARGVHALAPGARTIVEIGGQDAKVLWLHDDGTVRDFVMNDRCAAGSGRFLEVIAGRLGLPLAGDGPPHRPGREPAVINSTCVVFAETEILSLLAAGADPRDLAAGVQASIARRVAAMAGSRITDPLVFTGGVALVPGMAEALSAALGHAVQSLPMPQYTGALGAALLALPA